MDNSKLDAFIRPIATRLHANHMSRLGIASTMRLAYFYNRLKFGRQNRWRRVLYQTQLATLLKENGPLSRPPIEMKDGWAIDASMSLPHLDRVLEDSDKIIAERSGERRSSKGAYRSYFQDVWTPEDLERYPSFLDFATSGDVLSVVSHYLKSIPVLSTALPAGIRFVESNAAFDDQPDKPHDSQLYHIDYYSLPNVYILVLLRDTTHEHGPWTFLPCDIYSVVDRKETIEFCYPRGTVLFIESSGCFHYGSRNSIKPRFVLMIGYTGACRTDFGEVIRPQNVYPVRDTDSRLRKMVLNKNMLG